MSSPKLIQVLAHLSDEEWISLRKFLLQYTREESINYRCIQHLYTNRKKLDQDNIDKKIREKYFSDIKPKAFSNVLSRLFLWLEEWLAVATFQEDSNAVQLALIKKYDQLGLYKMANQVATKLESNLRDVEKTDTMHNRVLSDFYHGQYYSSNPAKKDSYSMLQKVCQSFLNNIAEQSVYYLLETNSTAKLRSSEFSELNTTLEKIVAITPDTELSRTLKLCLEIVKKPTSKIVAQLIEKLESGIIDEASDLYLVLSIYLRRSAAELWIDGQLDNASLAMRCYHISLVATESNKRQKFTVTNLFNVVGTLGIILSFEETAQFINKWALKAYSKYPESVVQYCHAMNAFRHDKYDLLPKLLTGLDFDYYQYKVISNAIMIIAQYKLGEEDLTITLIHNMKKQLKRNKSNLSKSLSLRINNLIELIRILAKSKYDPSIEINIDDYHPLYFKSWVLKQL